MKTQNSLKLFVR